ncbi:amino acid adenylation domain-containing protein [Fulvivirga sp. M361]|uniref:non-ribosomal peptide synthetase n=1 Tax=Fulvivirga sp. M361 TaxID=2594266 RepID=UPI00117AE298|nr:non-ribosomal peptide synthetase [Fulvivirga sp. M361]TRX60217.1 amino acid adenylation domain-containing protein [Fulvivirga sp. M361]
MEPISIKGQKLYPASSQQEGVWYHAFKAGTAYWNFIEIQFYEGELDSPLLIRAIEQVVKRHSALRTNFMIKNDQLHQLVHGQVDISGSVIFNRYEKSEAREADLSVERIIQEEESYEFNLEKDRLFRFRILDFDRRYCFILNVNHIITDSVSMQIFWKEVIGFYNTYHKKYQKFNVLPVDQYSSYACSQAEFRDSKAFGIQKDYWLQKLSNHPLDLRLSFYRNRSEISIHHAEVEVPPSLVSAIRTLSLRKRVVYSSIFQLAYFILLHKYTGLNEMAIANSLSGRGFGKQKHNNTLGLFANRVINTLHLLPTDSISNLVQKVHQELVSDFQHADMALEEVTREVNKQKKRTITHPLSLAVFNMIKSGASLDSLEGMTVLPKTHKNNNVGDIGMDVGLTILEGLGVTRIRLDLKCDTFFRPMVSLILDNYLIILEQCVFHPDKNVSAIHALGAKESSIIDTFNESTGIPFEETTLAHLFVQKALINSSKKALLFNGQTITYQELHLRSSRLANYLKNQDVGKERLVALCMDRSIDLIISILGILKAGAAYVPIDPDYPGSRIRHMLTDTGTKMVITHSRTWSKTGLDLNITTICLDNDWPVINKESVICSVRGITPYHLAYVIYTSGSTGKPKGVMVEHRSVTNTILSHIEEWQVKNTDRMLQFASLSFDASVNEIFIALCSGIPLVLMDKSTILDREKFIDEIHKQSVTLAILTPAYLKMLTRESVEKLRVLTTAGEVANVEQLARLSERLTCYNGYGPTECSVCASMHAISPQDINGKRLPIGKPIRNTFIRILDQYDNQLPIGAIGEIVIGGKGVARGYWKDPALTVERFVRTKNDPGVKVYKTGDIGRWLPDGTIDYLHRKDDQVKLRGFRIDLGEIENAVRNSGLVNDFTALLKNTHQEEKHILGCITIDNEDFKLNNLIYYLNNELPRHLMPSAWVVLDVFPLTTSGKIDKKKLLTLETKVVNSEEYMPPRNRTDHFLAALWKELTGLSQISITDDFFKIGGHSLLVMKMMSAIRNTWHCEVSIEEIFNHSSIQTLSDLIDAREKVSKTDVVKRSTMDVPVPLSYQQEALWFLDQLGGSAHYHIPGMYKVNGHLNTDALSRACKALMQRHEPLRTVCREKEGVCYQEVRDMDDWSVTLHSCHDLSDNEIREFISELCVAPFKLEEDPLLKVSVLQCSTEQFLVISIHHIAFDGWSWKIFTEELQVLYEQQLSPPISYELAALPIKYTDYVLWQREQLKTVLKDKLVYWKRKLAGSQPLNLPTDHSRPSVQSTRGATVYFDLDKALSDDIRHFTHHHGVTLYTTFLASLSVLLYRYSGQEDFCIGMPVTGRHHDQNLEQLIGFFSNTIVTRIVVDETLTFSKFLHYIKNELTEAYAHQDAPFEKVVEAVSDQRDISHNPLFQVMLNLQHTALSDELKLGDAALTKIDTDVSTSKFDLNISMIDDGRSIGINIEYCKDLFFESTVNRMANAYIRLLASITTHSAAVQTIGRLNMISGKEKDVLLHAAASGPFDYPKDKTIVDLIYQHVLRTPDQIALVCGSDKMTYKQLWARSGQVSAHLIHEGTGEPDLVALCVDRSLDMLIGILGILRSGAAYVPIDPEYPIQRISFILADTGAKMVLVNQHTQASIQEPDRGKLVLLERIKEMEPVHDPEIKPSQLAYVLYTSGSTGDPKGVMVEHRNVVLLLFGFQHVAGEPERGVGLSLCPYVFDVSVWEFFINLCFGHTLHLPEGAETVDPVAISEYVLDHGITTAYLPPTLLQDIIDHMTSREKPSMLTRLLVGVMSIPQKTLQAYKDLHPELHIINGYGPTESTICATFYPFTAATELESATPIGKAVGNNRIFLLDSNDQLVPFGAYGELCITGDGVSRGYWNNPVMTRQKFKACPFDQTRSLMYKTGDLARWKEDGNLEYIGRLDDQLKIGGYRIEPGEIESKLLQSGWVKKAIVLATSDTPKRLTGYVVSEDNDQDQRKLVRYLRSCLPEYMVPKQWVFLQEMPVTPNGKIDKRLLSREKVHSTTYDYVPAMNRTQERMTTIWKELLEVEKIGIYDDFFLLGGNSILSVQLVTRLKDAFEVAIPLKVLFQMANIAALSEYIQVIRSHEVRVNDTPDYEVIRF